MPSPFQTPCDKNIKRDDGELKIWLPRPNIILVRVSGYLHHDFALEIITCLNAIPRAQRVEQFHDWLGISGFDIKCQRDLTAWHATNHARVARLDIAAHSAFVRMGVTVANVALKGMIRLYDQVAPFEAQAEQAVRAAR